MRWIVISLLLVNALILGWRWWANTNDASTAAVAAAPVVQPAIELLPDGAVAAAVPLATEIPNDVAAGPAALAADEPASASPDVAVPAIEPAATAELPTATSNADAAIATAETTPAQLSPTPASASVHCAWTDWQAKPSTLAEGSELVREESRELELGRSYLVYIPALASREQTLARLAEVKTLGVEAAFLNKGPQAGGISLGLFSKPESMQVRMAELSKAGVSDALGIERIRTEAQTRQLLRWTGEKTPTSVQNQALVSCNDVAPATSGQ